MKSKRIINIETKVLPNGGASCIANLHYDQPVESCKTAVVKAMMALNELCDRNKLGFFLVAHDKATQKQLKITFEGD